MNRALLFGLAIFFAVVGVAILSGDSNVVLAGHGCHGCDGNSCCGAQTCCGPAACSGDCGGSRCGLFSRLRSRGCCGCDGGCAPSCCAPAACTPSCAAPGSMGGQGGQQLPPEPAQPGTGT